MLCWGKTVKGVICLFLLLLLSGPGDTAARERFLRLYLRGRAAAFRAAMALLGDRSLAEEALQTGCLKALENFLKDPREKTEGWLVMIVRNTAIDMLRARRDHLPLEDWTPPAAPETAESGAAFRQMLDAIRGLPENYREAVWRRCVLEQNVSEIAAALGLSESAAANRISRGRTLLIRKLEEEGYCRDK